MKIFASTLKHNLDKSRLEGKSIIFTHILELSVVFSSYLMLQALFFDGFLFFFLRELALPSILYYFIFIFIF